MYAIKLIHYWLSMQNLLCEHCAQFVYHYTLLTTKHSCKIRGAERYKLLNMMYRYIPLTDVHPVKLQYVPISNVNFLTCVTFQPANFFFIFTEQWCLYNKSLFYGKILIKIKQKKYVLRLSFIGN